MPHLTSRRHALVVRCREIARGDQDALLLLDGAHLVGDALKAGLHIHEAIISAAAMDRADIQQIVGALSSRGVEAATASASVMDAVSLLKSASEIVAIAGRPPCGAARMYAGALPLVVMAVDVQNPGNLGAIVRVAEAGGATGVVAAGDSANPFGWKALRGSMASALRLPIAVQRRSDLAIEEARRQGCAIVAAVARAGTAHLDLDLGGPTAILVGGEGGGIAPALVDAADLRVTIPMAEAVESLNVAMATAILVYEARRQRSRMGSAP